MRQTPKLEKGETDSPSTRRWFILGVAWLSYFGIALSWYVMPTLQPKLMEIYGLSQSQYSTAFTIPYLVAGLLALGGGTLSDKLGVRKAATLGIIVAALGLMARSIVGGYINLLVPMIVIGMGMGLIMPNLPKLVSVWFPPEETGLATGIYNTGLMGGVSTGLIVAPILPGWSSGNIMLGAFVLALAVAFFLIVRDFPRGKESRGSSILDGLKAAMGSSSIWPATLAIFVALAGMVSFQGALPTGLNEVYGISMSTAGGIASLITYLGIVGSLTIPPVASRLGKQGIFLAVLSVSFSVFMVSAWVFGGSLVFLWVGTAIAGYLAGGTLPLLMEVPVFLARDEDDPVNQEHVGGASGLLTSAMNLGGFVGLPFIVTPFITNFSYTMGFIVAGVLFGLQALFSLFIRFPE